jgi:hypothetical protein
MSVDDFNAKVICILIFRAVHTSLSFIKPESSASRLRVREAEQSMMTIQHALHTQLIKPQFHQLQPLAVKKEAFHAWVQLAASMAASGCVRKASRSLGYCGA